MSYGNYGPPPNRGPPGYGGGGGYPPPGGFGGPPQQPAMPPGADPQLWNWFISVDVDGSGHITVPELQKALINGDWTPFDLDTVKLLMSIFDTDRSGHIAFNEFSGLWKYIKDWQGVFRHYDRDRSGSIEGEELKAALHQFGYNLSNQLLAQIQQKYEPHAGSAAPAPPSGPGGFSMPGVGGAAGAGGITFDRFLRACVVVKQLTDSFNKLDTEKRGWIQINYDQYMAIVLAAP